ncbi:ThiF family adenylyltransferase [Dactylosporangium sp. NPDC050588]|uniref:ThiF family adenylyltransferase n=1 Tax=Dactylosporangium sp. NPDC050588 TaxID=3157211 RepID=UPI0033CBCFAC
MSGQSRFTRPKLIDAVAAVRLDSGRLALRDGARGRTALVLHVGPAAAAALPDLLDGTRDPDAVRRALAEHLATGDPDDVLRRIEDAGLLEDGAAPVTLSDEQARRYSRNLACYAAEAAGRPGDATLGSKYDVHERLRASRVLVLGLGGIGSNVALGLAMLGVGTVALVDFDTVEVQNLNRQVLYDTAGLGRPKAEAAAERLRAVNPEPDYPYLTRRVGGTADVVELIERFRPQITVLGADRPVRAIDRWTSAASWQTGVPYITGTVNGGYGAVWSHFPGRTGCEECTLLGLRDRSAEEYEIARRREAEDILPLTSALGFGAQTVAGLIGYDIYHHLIGLTVRSAGVWLRIDFGTFTVDETPQPVHPACGLHIAGTA